MKFAKMKKMLVRGICIDCMIIGSDPDTRLSSPPSVRRLFAFDLCP